MTDPTAQASAEEDIVRTIVAELSGQEWASASARFGSLGQAGVTSMGARHANGDRISVRPPWGGLQEKFRVLRSAMSNPQQGAWLTCTVEVRPDGTSTFDYNYDRPVQFGPGPMIVDKPDRSSLGYPSLADYIADLEQHPRDPEYVPDWYPGVKDLPKPLDPDVVFAEALTRDGGVPAAYVDLVARDEHWAELAAAASVSVAQEIRGMTDPIYRDLLPGSTVDRWELIEPHALEAWERVVRPLVYERDVAHLICLAESLGEDVTTIPESVDRAARVEAAGDPVTGSDLLRRIQDAVIHLINQQFAGRLSLPS